MSESENPAEIARQTLRLLASRRILPTPDNYQLQYEEVSGVAGPENPALAQIRELLAKTLEFAVNAESGHSRELIADCVELAAEARAATDRQTQARLAAHLKKFWFRLDSHGVLQHQTFEGVVRLLRLMITNTHELLADDVRLGAQVEALREIAEQPLSLDSIDEAERRIKELIFRQGTMRHGIGEAQSALKQMISTFIERIGGLTEVAGEFGEKLEVYAEKFAKADGISELNALLGELLLDTNAARLSAAQTHVDLLTARRQVEDAETKVRTLEAELMRAAGLVSQDHLTGALNRRGLEKAFAREAVQADRHNVELCVAILDIDNFKVFNDSHGHLAGDSALQHMIRVLATELRPGDTVARYGGEEFVLLLPGSSLEDGVAALVRHQRRLTREFFLHNNERLLITFSAGVVMRRHAESIDSVLSRADACLYSAKRGGRNRVCTE